MSPLRTGVDLVEIERLSGPNPAVRQRFLRRVFTPRELEECGASQQSMAGRFAAKEAVAKALGVGIGPVAWQEIEILSGPEGQPVLQLHGAARELAGRLGLITWSISLSHTRAHAVAVAVATGKQEEPSV